MKIMSNVIARLPSDEYAEFCRWLRECCCITISELIDRSITRQNNLYEQFLHESKPEDFSEL